LHTVYYAMCNVAKNLYPSVNPVILHEYHCNTFLGWIYSTVLLHMAHRCKVTTFCLYGISVSFWQKACFLLTLRLWCYRREKLHYFLFDFCYFTNLLLLVYLWLIPPGHVAGYMFIVLFCFANGPLLWATAFWRNSLVFHSVDKMTSLFIHISPAVTVSALRWWVVVKSLIWHYHIIQVFHKLYNVS